MIKLIPELTPGDFYVQINTMLLGISSQKPTGFCWCTSLHRCINRGGSLSR